jgi:monofunctional biosynthetic peptidoglycan transglycosylase
LNTGFDVILSTDDIQKRNRPLWVWLIYLPVAGIIIILSLYLLILITMPEVEVLKDSNPESTALIQDRVDEAKASGKKYIVRQRWVTFKQIPDLLKKAIRISEDAGFYLHHGVDLEELEESIKKNWQEGRFARGGSTITQQLAKNLYLSTDKSIWRKIRELFIAHKLEETLTKNRIFHLYLNLIEFGPGIFGVDAASRYFFGKSVSLMSSDEMIRLAAIISKPLTARPDRDTRWLLWRCRWITGKLYLYKYIEEPEHDYLLNLFTPQ